MSFYLSKVKVGDSIWNVQEGWAEVKRRRDDFTYPIETRKYSYTLDGKRLISDSFPSAFTFNPFEQPQPFEGYWAMVSNRTINEQNTGNKRFVFMEKNGKFITWRGAETDEEVKEIIFTTGWKYAQRIPKQVPVPEYTVEELTALVGHDFKIKK